MAVFSLWQATQFWFRNGPAVCSNDASSDGGEPSAASEGSELRFQAITTAPTRAMPNLACGLVGVMDPAATVAVAGAPASFSSYATELACWEPESVPGRVTQALYARARLASCQQAILAGSYDAARFFLGRHTEGVDSRFEIAQVETCKRSALSSSVFPGAAGLRGRGSSRWQERCPQVARQCKLAPATVKVRDAIRILDEHGFRLKRTRGSQRQFEGVVSAQRRLVTVAGKEGDDLARDTLASIARQSALPRRMFGRR